MGFANVDQRKSRSLRPQPAALSERSDRRGMGACRPLIPPAKRGNRRHVDECEVVNGLMYVLSTGCQWRAVPKGLPPRSTLYDYFDRWNWDGTLDRIHDALYVKCREAAAREASPTVAIIYSQSVKSAEKDPMRVDGGRTG